MRTKSEEIFTKIREFINKYYLENGVSPSTREIESGTGINRVTAQRYLKTMKENGEIEYGKRRGISTDFSRTICGHVLAPLYGTVKCGIPSEPFIDVEETVKLPKAWVGDGDFFILQADGDSMKNAGIEPGDLVVIRRQDSANNGEIAVVLLENETTLKRFFREKDRAVLKAENDDYEDIVISGDRLGTILIQGVAVKVIKDLK